MNVSSRFLCTVRYGTSHSDARGSPQPPTVPVPQYHSTRHPSPPLARISRRAPKTDHLLNLIYIHK